MFKWNQKEFTSSTFIYKKAYFEHMSLYKSCNLLDLKTFSVLLFILPNNIYILKIFTMDMFILCEQMGDAYIMLVYFSYLFLNLVICILSNMIAGKY